MEKKNKIKVAAFAALSILSATAFAENLVPDKPSKGPNIWCTWGIQNGIGGEQAEKVRETVKREIAFEGDQGGGADFARSCINEDLIFGENGWANFWPEIRKDPSRSHRASRRRLGRSVQHAREKIRRIRLVRT